MSIIFSTIAPARPACPPPARSYFEAPDDALLARVTEKVAEQMGRHLSYVFHDEVPGGVTPIILEDVGPSAPPSETTVVNYPHAAVVVPGSLLLKEYPSRRTLTDNGRGHLIDQDGCSAATVDYEKGTIHQPHAMPERPIMTNTTPHGQALKPVVGGLYNWIGQPERLVYMGARRYPGDPRTWHQFAKVETPEVCWSEVLTADLASFEETKEPQ